jgi:nucleotide-binding universal stress UspA family protein
MKILIGYDGSRAAKAAVLDLRRAGLPSVAEVFMVSTVPPLLPLDMLAPESDTSPLYRKAYEEARMDVQRAEAKALEETGKEARALERNFPAWKITVESCLGKPAETLLQRAKKWKPDLIVLGSRGWNPLGKLLLGSVAEKVLVHAPGGVRIGKGKNAGKSAGKSRPIRLLIAFDGSRDAEGAVDLVVARAWPKGTEAKLVAAADLHMRLDEYLRPASKKTRGKEFIASPWPWIEGRLEEEVKKLNAAGLKASSKVLRSEARHALLSEARSFRADCIFLGSRGLSGWERFLLGSVSTAVAAHAPCSVEIVKNRRKG